MKRLASGYYTDGTYVVERIDLEADQAAGASGRSWWVVRLGPDSEVDDTYPTKWQAMEALEAKGSRE